MTLADREWRLVREEARPGATNMALDEIAARTAADGGPRTVRVYRWEPSTLSLGYNQQEESVAWKYCDDAGVDIVRRQTGGGGIYHDAFGDISYSISAPRDELPGDLMEAYHVLLEPILDAFDRMGVDAHLVEDEHPALHQPACYLRPLHPAHDLVAGESGRKISGNAQYRTRDAVVQHGSISYALQPDRHLATFADVPISDEAFTGRVTSIEEETELDRANAVDALESALGDWADADAGEWADDELAAASELAQAKYESAEWNRHCSDPTD